jgi:hypothetical protein
MAYKGIVFCFFSLLCNFATPSIASDEKALSLSCRTTSYMLDDFDEGNRTVVSPNGKRMVLLAKTFTFEVLEGKQALGRVEFKDLNSNVRIQWSPDSDKLAITYSDGGAIGLYHSHVYSVAANGMNELKDVSEVPFKDFKRDFYCPERGNNISVLGWQSDSTAVLFVAQVYPTGDCGKAAGSEAGYLVDLKGNIERQFGEEEIKRLEQECRKRGHASVPLAPHNNTAPMKDH